MLCQSFGIGIEIHPPKDDKYRAYCNVTGTVRKLHEPKEYLIRNYDIVDSSHYLVAVPKENMEVRRSGTWSTVRYARREGQSVWILFPDGRVDKQ